MVDDLVHAAHGKAPPLSWAAVGDFGFHYPVAIVMQVARHLEAYKVYPEPGGLWDQDAQLMEDLDTLAMLRAWREDVLYPHGDLGSPDRTFEYEGKTYSFS